MRLQILVPLLVGTAVIILFHLRLWMFVFKSHSWRMLPGIAASLGFYYGFLHVGSKRRRNW